MLLGAFLIASANALASSLYSRGVSQTSLFIVRGVTVYCMNAAQEALRSGRYSALRVATLSAGSRRLQALCWLRSIFGFLGITLINVSFQKMHLADAFALFFAVATLLTVALARACLGNADQLSVSALVGGVVGICGIVLVTQPEAIFGGGAPPSLMGVVTAIGSGSLFSGFNVLSRILGKPKSDDSTGGLRPSASPPMLVSYYMVTIEIGALAIAGEARPAAIMHPLSRHLSLHLSRCLPLCLSLCCPSQLRAPRASGRGSGRG